MGVHWTRECNMKINKIRPIFHFLTKTEKKNGLPSVFVLFFTVSTPIELFESLFVDV